MAVSFENYFRNERIVIYIQYVTLRYLNCHLCIPKLVYLNLLAKYHRNIKRYWGLKFVQCYFQYNKFEFFNKIDRYIVGGKSHVFANVIEIKHLVTDNYYR